MVSGSEVSPEGWVCVGGLGQSTGAENLSLLAVPVGTGFPPSTSLACAAPARTTAAANPDVSTFSSALATPAQAFGSPVHTLVGAAITLAVILFITFPAQLFNRTFEENYDEIRDISLRRLRWLRRFRRDAEREAGGLIRVGAFAAVVLVGLRFGSLNDPRLRPQHPLRRHLPGRRALHPGGDRGRGRGGGRLPAPSPPRCRGAAATRCPLALRLLPSVS